MLRLLVSVLMLVGGVMAARAHHSFVRYNGSKIVRVTGTITSVRYQNPHVIFTLETDKGSYQVEAEGVPVLKAKGLGADVLKPGAKATVAGWLGKNNAFEMGMSSITVGGRTVSVRGSTR